MLGVLGGGHVGEDSLGEVCCEGRGRIDRERRGGWAWRRGLVLRDIGEDERLDRYWCIVLIGIEFPFG